MERGIGGRSLAHALYTDKLHDVEEAALGTGSLHYQREREELKLALIGKFLCKMLVRRCSHPHARRLE